ncbi:MAG TPA: antibiotic biosynthesis monooxygenase [Steroidobacteraceae bacterium]|nr:antibiotic biosynthesis monooxygenase [Steroidobacteraceae bacterium]
MIAVLFEVEPNPQCMGAYLELAAALRPQLEKIDGFISIERFESLARPGVLLSLSYWRDEAAVKTWRGIPAHRSAQAEGRESLFADYRLRVCEVLRDYGMRDRTQAPEDLRAAHG